MKVSFIAPCYFRRCGVRATTNIRPIDHIGRPHANMDVCGAHADALVARRERTLARLRAVRK